MQHPSPPSVRRRNHRRTLHLAIALAAGAPACRVDDGGTGPATVVVAERADAGARPDAPGARRDLAAEHPAAERPAGEELVPVDAPAMPGDAAPDLVASDAGGSDGSAGRGPDADPDAGPSAVVPACAALPALPVRSRRVIAGARSDDFTFTADGHLVGFSGRDVVRALRAGASEVLAADVIGQRGGALRELGGELYIADFERSVVVVRGVDARVRPLPGRVESPMKMVRGPGGSLYVTGKGGVITKIDPALGARTVGSTPFELGGLTFSRDHQTLYVGALTVDGVHALDVRPDGTLGPARLWRGQIARAQALATDACDNVYVISENDSRVRRIDQRMAVAVVVDMREMYLWALAFGSGQQGWSADALYVQEASAGRIFELDIGVAGQPPP